MRNVQKIIESRGYALDGSDPFFAITIAKRTGYMCLAIEGIGLSPSKLQLVSVAHYYEQNGDLMRDPEMVFMIDKQPPTVRRPDPKGRLRWVPVSFTQDGGIPLYQEALIFDGSRVLMRMKLFAQLKSFARTWNKNLGEQGFVEVALSVFQQKAVG